MINPGQIFTQIAKLQRAQDILALTNPGVLEKDFVLYLNKLTVAIPIYRLKEDFIPISDFTSAVDLLHRAMENYHNIHHRKQGIYLQVIYHILNHTISLANIIIERQTSDRDTILSRLSEIYGIMRVKIYSALFADKFNTNGLFEINIHPKIYELLTTNIFGMNIYNIKKPSLTNADIEKDILNELDELYWLDDVNITSESNIHDENVLDNIMKNFSFLNGEITGDVLIDYLVTTAPDHNKLLRSAACILEEGIYFRDALMISKCYIKRFGVQGTRQLLRDNKITQSSPLAYMFNNLLATVPSSFFAFYSIMEHEISYNECRYHILKDSKCSTNVDLKKLNFSNVDEFYTVLLRHSLSPQTCLALNDLLEHANKCNAKQDEQHKVSMCGFELSYSCGLYVLTQTMGLDGIRLMKSKLVNTVAPLVRMLEPFYTSPNISLSQLANFYGRMKQEKVFSISDKLNFIKLLNLISLWQSCESHIATEHNVLFISSLDRHLRECTDINFVTKLIAGMLCQYLFGFSGITDTEINQASFSIDSINKISMYANAYPKMISKDFKQIFLDFLRQDLFSSGDEAGLIGLLKKHDEGTKLLKHNAKIKKRLISKGFNIDSLLRYDKKSYFHINVTHNDAELNQESQKISSYKLLISYLNKLAEKINDIDKPSKLLLTVKSHIDIINTKLDKLEEVDLDAFRLLCESQDLTARFSSLHKNLIKLVKLSSEKRAKSGYPNGIFEFAEHYVDTYQPTSPNHKQQFFTKTKNKSYHFRVEQWDKMNKDTYLLGDYTGCCLATNGAYFEAMVQRRMDDGMLFHVAIDQATGKPAALIWLYLAKTENKKIALVSNFFDVNNKYTRDEIRVPLLEALLHFTKQYCQDNPQLDGFHMARLNYGHNMHDLHKYISNGFDNDIIDKIGGPLILSRDNEGMTTSDIYYLASLESRHRHFNRLDEDKLNLHSSPSLIDIKQLITDVSQREYKNHQSVEQLVQYIKNNYLLAIAPFFESHAELEDYIINVIENNKISYGLAKLSA